LAFNSIEKDQGFKGFGEISEEYKNKFAISR
jgi:hypothetical protein